MIGLNDKQMSQTTALMKERIHLSLRGLLKHDFR